MAQKPGFPGWMAPWVGAIVCAGLTWYTMYKNTPGGPPAFAPQVIAGAAAIGFVVGVLLWLRDRFTRS